MKKLFFTQVSTIHFQVRLDLSIKYSGMPQTPEPSEHGDDLGVDTDREDEDAYAADGEKEGSEPQAPKEG